MEIQLNFDNRFARLPAAFYTRMNAEGFARAPYLIHANEQAARLIGLDPRLFADPAFPAYFSGNTSLPGAEPLAMVYAGHQFGVYVPQLGDGRALLLGQARNDKGELWDVQLKGSGLSPYSRFADGRAVLRSCIREYLCSEAMHGLGIPTTRALCIVGTGETVMRERPEPGAILTRLSRSHVRFGHFEYFYYTGQHEAVKQLADHVIGENFPDLAGKPDQYLLWYREVARRTARLMAQWQAAGFAHGVMNTDNMSIIGLTIDYGPFGFMDRFDPGFICNHSDVAGRYAFGRQPGIAHWNLFALANALQPLFPLSEAKAALDLFITVFEETYNEIMVRKTGMRDAKPGDEEHWRGLLYLMHKYNADYTLTFRGLSALTQDREQDWVLQFGDGSDEARGWLARWQERVAAEGSAEERRARMSAVNPKYVLRNWVAETAIRAAEDSQDFSIISKILRVFHTPFEEHPEAEEFASLPPPAMRELCVSCSS